MSIRSPKAARESDGFMDDDAERHVGTVLQLVAADQQQRVLDGIELGRLAVQQRRERRIDGLALVADALNERAKIAGVGASHIGIVGEFLLEVLPRTGVDLPSVE